MDSVENTREAIEEQIDVRANETKSSENTAHSIDMICVSPESEKSNIDNSDEKEPPNDAKVEAEAKGDKEDQLSELSDDQLKNLCSQKDDQIKQLQELIDQNNSKRKLDQLSDAQSNLEKKLKQQQLESSRKENILIMRLTLKEQELQECLVIF